MYHVANPKRLFVLYWVIIIGVALVAITGFNTPRIVVANSGGSSENYVGVELCAICHQEEFAAWNASYHNSAGLINITEGVRWYWVSPADLHNGSTRIYNQTDFARCASCHVTGYDAETGTWPNWNSTDPEEAEQFIGVQCEVCHGPGLMMEINYSASLCGSCHSQPNDLVMSGHNNALQAVQSGLLGSADCLHCKSTQGFLGENVTFDTVGLESVSCVACHSPHDATNDYQLREENATETCRQCHEAPSHDVTYEMLIDGPHEKAGVVTYEMFIEGPHEKSGVECTECHGQGERIWHDEPDYWFNHTFSIYGTVYPYNQTDPLVCGNCHDQSWATTQLSILQGNVEEVIYNVTQAISEAENVITTASQTSGVDTAKVSQAEAMVTEADYLVTYVDRDNSRGFHNPEKAFELLSEAWYLLDEANALVNEALREGASDQLTSVQGQLSLTQTFMYVGAIGGIIGGLALGLSVGRRWGS